MNPAGTIHIGTRGSALALAQAGMVRDALVAAGAAADIVIITTEGDRRAADTAWGEGAFVTAIEAALVGGEIDVAVHSAKDVPTDENPRLAIAAFLERAPSADVVVLPVGRLGSSLEDLPGGSRVGTDSPRRTAFLRAVRPDLVMHPLHGNVDTRLRKLDEGQSDALVLAEAGLTRLGRADRISFRLEPDVVPPAPGQGAIAVQVRAADLTTVAAVARLDHAPTRTAVEAERSLLAASGGGCRAPLGALGHVDVEGRLHLLGGFARPDGTLATIASRTGAYDDPETVDGLLGDLARLAAGAARSNGDPTVLVTRSAEQAPALALALVDRGFAPIVVPAIEIEPARDGLDAALGQLQDYDWVVITSANAVKAVCTSAARVGARLGGRLDAAPRAPGSGRDRGPRWAAVGTATGRALRAAGVTVDRQPRRTSGAALADDLPLQGGERILVPRSELADDALIERLAARGARVEPVVAYRTLEGPAASAGLLAPGLAASPRAVVFTSGSTARGLLALADELGGDATARVLQVPAVCIGSTTGTEARRLGFNVVAESSGQAVAAVADAVAGYLHEVQEPT